MRKFTKEISALLASVALGAVTCAGTAFAPPEQIEPTAGVMAIPDETVESATEECFPPEAGEILLEIPTEPPTEEELPPTAGIPMPSDELTEPTTEEIPPLAGDIAPADGDINGDGSLSVSDVVLLQKWLSGVSNTRLANWRAADLYEDGKLNVFDLSLMKKALIRENQTRNITVDESE